MPKMRLILRVQYCERAAKLLGCSRRGRREGRQRGIGVHARMLLGGPVLALRFGQVRLIEDENVSVERVLLVQDRADAFVGHVGARFLEIFEKGGARLVRRLQLVDVLYLQEVRAMRHDLVQ